MTLIRLIQEMHNLDRIHHKRIFTLREMAALAQEPRTAAAMTLLRAAQKGLVARTGNLWMNLMDPPEILEVALSLASPSYLSFESALYRRGILSQAPRGGLTMATAGRPRRFQTPWGEIQFFHLKPSLFFGFDEHRIASAEKAWLDLIYLRGLRGRRNVLSEEIDREPLDRKYLRAMTKKFPPWVRSMAMANNP